MFFLSSCEHNFLELFLVETQRGGGPRVYYSENLFREHVLNDLDKSEFIYVVCSRV